jgi:hypothetical protein
MPEKKKVAALEEKTEVLFSKKQLLEAKQLSDKKDLLNAILDDSEKYSVESVKKLIDGYMKGKVK